MTKDQIEALILTNLSAQFDQLVAIYNAINGGTSPDAAQALLQKLKDLQNVLDQGLANLILQAQRALIYAND